MIKLHRTNPPEELTIDVVQKLTEKYKKTKQSVWRKLFIQKALLETSHGKCAYCEMKLGEEGKFMHIDHYHHKGKYPNEVVKWENLIPSCNRCNINKGTHDTCSEPIINPYSDNPVEYVYMENYRFKSRNNNQLGKTTIDILYLNDTESLVLPRFTVGNKIQEKIQELLDMVDNYIINSDSKRRNKIVNSIKNILKEVRPNREYSALVATVLIGDSEYEHIRDKLKKHDLWDEEMESLHNYALQIALLK